MIVFFNLIILMLIFFVNPAKADEEKFSAYTNPDRPVLTINPASIVQIPSDNLEFDFPIIYEINNSTSQAIYLKDIDSDSAQQSYQNEKKTIFSSKIITRGFGFIYEYDKTEFKNPTQTSCNDFVESGDICNLSSSISTGFNFEKEEIDSQKRALVIGGLFGSILLGMKYQRVNKKIILMAQNNVDYGINQYISYKFNNTYESEYHIQNYGMLLTMGIMNFSVFHQPQVQAKLIRSAVFTNNVFSDDMINFIEPEKTILGVQLNLNLSRNLKTSITYDTGQTSKIKADKSIEGIGIINQEITGLMGNVIINKRIFISSGNNEFTLGSLNFNKSFKEIFIINVYIS